MNEHWIRNRQRVGANIRDLRNAQNLSQRKFAQMVDMDHAHVSNIENGSRNPTLDTLSNIADGLDVDVSALFAPRGDDVTYAIARDD